MCGRSFAKVLLVALVVSSFWAQEASKEKRIVKHVLFRVDKIHKGDQYTYTVIPMQPVELTFTLEESQAAPLEKALLTCDMYARVFEINGHPVVQTVARCADGSTLVLSNVDFPPNN